MKVTNIGKVAILAGEGYLPLHVADACKEQGIEYIIIGFDGDVSLDLFAGRHDVEVFKVYSLGKILKHLYASGVTHVSLAGKVKRAELSRLLLDLKGAKLLASILKNGLADNAILTTIISFIENEGFSVVAPEVIAREIVLGAGCITKVCPTTEAMQDIKKGIKILRGIADFDVGQSLVIQGGLVLGVEAAEGTDALLHRCGQVRQSVDVPPILIKVSKPHQDRRVDLPCIGEETILNAFRNGIAGIALEAGSTLILDQGKTVKMADEYKIFIVGI